MKNQIFCAIDKPDYDEASALVAKVGPHTGAIKLGMTFFNKNGPQGIAKIMQDNPGPDLFLDLKLHDIPMQVAGAVRALIALEPAFLTIHASGGFDMMCEAAKAAKDEAEKTGVKRPKILGITVLTSLDEDALNGVGQKGPAQDQVERLAKLAKDAGLDGIVCSPLEVAHLRSILGDDFILMVPGIRPKGADLGDQKRVMTPGLAVKSGATHLVIGRPITGADDALAVVEEIKQDIDAALKLCA